MPEILNGGGASTQTPAPSGGASVSTPAPATDVNSFDPSSTSDPMQAARDYMLPRMQEAFKEGGMPKPLTPDGQPQSPHLRVVPPAGQQVQPEKIKIGDEEYDFKVVQETMKNRNRLLDNLKKHVETKNQENSRIYKTAQEALRQAEAKEAALKEMEARIFGARPGQQPGQQQQIQPGQLDINDPLYGPLAQKLLGIEKMLEDQRSYRDPYTTMQIERTFQNIEKQLGPRFNDVVPRIAADMGIQPDPRTGQLNLASMEPGKALALAQQVQDYEASVQEYGKQYDGWFAKASESTDYVSELPELRQAVFARLMQELQNPDRQGVPIAFEDMKMWVDELETNTRRKIEARTAKLAQTRAQAGNPIVPTGAAGGAPVRTSPENAEIVNDESGNPSFLATGRKYMGQRGG